MTLTAADVLVVVPALDEEATIGAVVREIRQTGFLVLVVSDGSTDATVEVAADAGARVLHLPFNIGVGGALRAGFRFAVDQGFLAVVQVDADGQHPIGAIHELLEEKNRSGVDMVVGSRFHGKAATMQVSSVRRLVMRVLSRSATRATGTRITDATSGFRLIAQPLLGAFADSFPDYYLGDTFEALVSAGRAGYRITEIPADLTPRLVGQSSANPIQAAKFTVKSLCLASLRIHFPLRPPR